MRVASNPTISSGPYDVLQGKHRPGASDSYSVGDAEERAVLDWIKNNTNNDDLIAELAASSDFDEMNAFDFWARGSFMGGQMYGDWDDMNSREQGAVRVYDKFIDRSVFSKGVVVARVASPELLFGKGHYDTNLAELQAMKGAVIKCKSCLSTSAAQEGLTIWDNEPIEYKIKIPAGAKGAGMWISDPRINRTFKTSQREVMMNRDSKYRVGSTKYNAARGVYEVELEWIGHDPHKYGASGRASSGGNWAGWDFD